MNTSKLGPFLGINNRLPDHQLVVGTQERKTGDYLRNAVNVDLTDAGTLRRRKGTTLAVPCTDAHSLWGDASGAFYVDDTTLYAYPRTAVRAGLSAGRGVSFARTPRGVFWSNGVVLERVRNGASEPPHTLPLNPAPVVAAAAGGALPAGVYQVAVTLHAADGEESPSTWPTPVAVPADGVITVTGLPGTAASVYLTPPNGDILMLALTTAATSATFAVLPLLGRQLPLLPLQSLPPGQVLRVHNGRLLSAAGNMLFVSEPYQYGLYHPLRGHIPFPARISIVEPVDGGVYVCADKTYWLAGADPLQATGLEEVLPYGAVEGTGGSNPTAKEAFWFSERGLVVGDSAGKVRNVQESAVAVEQAASGAALFRVQDGVEQVLASLSGAKPSVAAAISYMDAEVVRKESML